MTTNLVFATEAGFQKHCAEQESRTFVTYKGNVYDVTEFLDDHPGGAAFILDFQSKDISEVFHDDDYHEHSDNALRMLLKYKVGCIKSQTSKDDKEAEEVEAYPKITKDKV